LRKHCGIGPHTRAAASREIAMSVATIEMTPFVVHVGIVTILAENISNHVYLYTLEAI